MNPDSAPSERSGEEAVILEVLGSSGLDALDTPSVGGSPGLPGTQGRAGGSGLQDNSPSCSELPSHGEADTTEQQADCFPMRVSHTCTWMHLAVPGAGLAEAHFGAQEHLARLTSDLRNQNFGKLISSP